jgi:hypothetical protein
LKQHNDELRRDNEMIRNHFGLGLGPQASNSGPFGEAEPPFGTARGCQSPNNTQNIVHYQQQHSHHHQLGEGEYERDFNQIRGVTGDEQEQRGDQSFDHEAEGRKGNDAKIEEIEEQDPAEEDDEDDNDEADVVEEEERKKSQRLKPPKTTTEGTDNFFG